MNIVPSSSSMNSNRKEAATLSACVRFGTVADLHAYFDISNSSLAVDVDELQRALVWAIQYRTFSVVKFLTEIFRGIFESKRLSYSSILPDASYDPLVTSLRCARWQVFDLLLNQGFDLLSSLEKLSEREVGRALQEVCLSGSLSRIEAFLQAGVSTEALCNANGDTALMVAVATDAPAPAIELLLRYGANPNAVNAVGKSVLRFWACSSRASDKEKILHILLSAGADFGHADAKWTHGSVLFDLADSWRPSHPPSIVSRLRRLGIDLHSRRSSGTSVLMVAARNPYSLTLLKTLVASGAPLNLQDRLGWTALMHAIDAGVKDSCLILIKSGCDVALRNQADMDALAMLNVRNHWTLWGVEDRLERALEKSKQKALRIPQVNVPQSTVGPASEKRMCDVIDVPQEDGYAESETSETEDASEEIEDNSQGMGNFSDPESVSESSSSDSEEDVAGIVSTPATRQSRSGRRVSFSSIVEVDTADTSSHLEGNSLKKKLYVLEEENLQLFALVQKLQQQLAASPGTNAVTPFSPAPGAWQADCPVSDDALRTAHLDDSTNPFCSPLLASPTSMLDTFAHVEHFSSFGDTSLRSIRDENLAMAGELHEKNAVLESIIHFLTESLGQSVNMADLPQVVRSLATDLKDTAHSLDAVRSELATESKAAADLEVRLQQATLEGNQSSAPAAAGFDVARENGPFTESQDALTNQVADLETILDAVRRELAAESACVADLDCQLRAALAGNAKLESDISVLLCQLSDARDACDRQTDELQKELRRTAEECATAKLNESILATRWSEQCAVLAAVQSELQSRSSQCADLQESLDTTTAEKELLASRLEMALRESSEKEIAAETKSKAMTQELMLRNCELTSLRSAVADKQYALEVESEKFSLVIAESENQQSLLREQVEELEDEIRAMRAQLTDAAAADAERELKLTNTESAISSMNLLVCSLQEQVEKLEMELVSKCANLSAVASEADVKAKQSSELLLERDDTIANLRSQLAELQAKAEIAAVQASHLLVESEHKWKLEVERQNALVADLQSKLATVQVAVTVEREEGSYRLSDLRFQVADQQQALTERDDTIAALRLEVETALHAVGLKSVSESAATARILELEIMTEKLQSELETTRGVCAAHLGTVSDVSKAESTISVLQCDVAKRDRQIIDLLEQLKSVTEASQAELSSAHSDLSAARQQVLTLEERLLACDAGMDDLRHLINSSDATASAREHHHAVIVGQLQENVHALETQVSDLRIAAHSAEHSLAAELEHAQHTIHELEKKILLQEQELSKRDRHIFGLREQFDEAVSALHSERSRNDVAANDMLRQVTELRTHLEERDRCILDLESQLNSLKVTNQSQQDGGVLPAMLEALNAELEAAQVALRVAEESLGTVSAERDILMQQLSRMATKLAEIHETKVSTARISETAGVHHNLEDDIPPVVCSAPSETNSPSYAVAPLHGLVTHLDEHSVPDQPVAVVPSVVTSDDRLLRLDHRTNEVHRLRRFYSVLSKFLVDVDDSPLRRLLDDKKFAPRVRLVGANARLSSRSSSSGETKASRLPNVWRY